MKKKLNKKNIYKNKNSKLDFTKYVKNKITYEFRNKVEDDRWLTQIHLGIGNNFLNLHAIGNVEILEFAT